MDAIPSGHDLDPTGPRKPAGQIIVIECPICGTRNTFLNNEERTCKNERCGKLPPIQPDAPKPPTGRARVYAEAPKTIEKVYPICRVKR